MDVVSYRQKVKEALESMLGLFENLDDELSAFYYEVYIEDKIDKHYDFVYIRPDMSGFYAKTDVAGRVQKMMERILKEPCFRGESEDERVCRILNY